MNGHFVYCKQSTAYVCNYFEPDNGQANDVHFMLVDGSDNVTLQTEGSSAVVKQEFLVKGRMGIGEDQRG